MVRGFFAQTAAGKVKKSLAIAAMGSLILSGACSQPDALTRIRNKGKITAITLRAPYTHFVYQNQRLGFEYDLASAFADYLGVKLDIVTPERDALMQTLQSGRGDFIAANFSVTPGREDVAAFTVPYSTAEVQLVVNLKNNAIKCPDDLKGKSVHVRAGSAAEECLNQLRDGGAPFEIVRRDKSSEELIAMVRDGIIDCTATDLKVLRLCQRYHPDVKAAFPVSGSLPVVWATAKDNAGLVTAMNQFLTQAKEDGTLENLQHRYFGNGEAPEYMDLRHFHSRVKSRLPRYEKAIKDVAADNRMDWRIIAAIMYQESQFNPFAESFTGVKGLMQLTEVTAMEMGIEDRQDPEQSIRAGTEYIVKMMDRFPEAEEPDRLRLALAAYNVGYGHVRDAMKLAGEMGMNPARWPSLEHTLPLLRRHKYYSKTQYGYCRGTEPVRYVNAVMTYFDILRREAVIL